MKHRRTASYDVPSKRNGFFLMRPLALAVALTLPGVVIAAGVDPTVAAGQATVQQSGLTTTVNQGSARAVVDWRALSLAKNEQFIVLQNASSDVLLNRVTGGEASLFDGSLQSKGSVFFLNPNGIIFGKNFRADVGGLVASTLALGNDDFLKGKYHFTPTIGLGEHAGKVINEGTISAVGGSIVLLGHEVINAGTLSAPGGRVGMAATDDVLVDVEGDGLLFFSVKASDAKARLQQLGKVEADGGSVELMAAARGAFADTVLNMQGQVQARGLGMKQGRVVIGGTDDGIVAVSGTVDATNAAGRGGDVTVTGQRVLVDGSAVVDASGRTGGGAIHVGGGYQGGDPTIRNADVTAVLPGAKLRANAIESGRGGDIVVWSDKTTRYYGDAQARGGAASGNGGSAEVSGKQFLDFKGGVNLSSPHGHAGTLLLDPRNIEINNGAVTEVTAGPLTAGEYLVTADATLSPPSDLTWAQLGTLLTTGDVRITTAGGPLSYAGDIVVAASNHGSSNVDWSGHTLTLDAVADITVNAPIVNAGTGHLTFKSGNNIDVNKNISLSGGAFSAVADRQFTLDSSASISTSGGLLTVGVTGSGGPSTAIAVNGVMNSGTGTLTLNSGSRDITVANNALVFGDATHAASANLTGDHVTVGALALAGGSTLTVTNSHDSTQTGALTGTGNLTKAGDGTFTLSASNTYTGTTTISRGTLATSADDRLSDTSTVSINGSNASLKLGGNDTVAGLVLTNGSLDQSGGADKTLTAATYELHDGAVNAQLGAGTLTQQTGSSTLNKAAAATTVQVAGGTLNLGADNRLSDSANVSVSGGGTLHMGSFVDTVNTLSIASGTLARTGTNGTAALTASGGFTKVSDGSPTDGTATIGAKLITPTVNINAGDVQLAAADRLAAAAVVTVTGTSSSLTLGGNQSITRLELAGGRVTGTGTLAASDAHNLNGGLIDTNVVLGGAGTLKQLSGNTALNGSATNSAVEITGGTLTITTAERLSNSAAVTFNGTGQLALGANETVGQISGNSGATASVALSNGAVLGVSSDSNSNFSGVITGNGGLAKSGEGVLTISAAQTYTGSTQITNGTLATATAADVLPTGGTVSLSGDGVLALGTDQRLAGVSGSSAAAVVNLGAHTLTIDTSNASPAAFGGQIIGVGGRLAKTGSGAFIVNGDGNTFSGGTTISQGAVVIGANDAHGSLGSGTISLANNSAELRFNRSDVYTLNQTVSGGAFGQGVVRQAGSGTVIFTNGLTHSQTLIDSGKVQLNDGSSLQGAGTVVIASGAELVANYSGARDLNVAISGNGGVRQIGAGTLTLNGNNSYSGNTALADNTSVIAANGHAIGDASTVSLGNNATLTLNADETVGGLSGTGTVQLTDTGALAGHALTVNAGTDNLFAGRITSSAGGGTLIKTGSATLTLTGNNNDYSNGTTIAAGRLQIGNGGSTGSLGSGAVVDHGILAFNRSGDLTVEIAVTGTGSIEQNGSGTVTLGTGGSFAHTGSTTVNSGTLATSNTPTGQLAAGSSITINGGTFALARDESIGALNLSGGTLDTTGGAATLKAGTYTLNGGTVKTNVTLGDGAADAGTLNQTGNLTTLDGVANVGAINISGGTLRLGAAERLNNTAPVVFSGSGRLELGGNEVIGTLSGASSASSIALGGSTLTVSNSGDGSFAGVISGTGGLTKTNFGRLTLTGVNTYTGDTVVALGTLATSGAGRLSSATNVTVSAPFFFGPGVLELGSNQTVASLSGGGNVLLGAHTLTTGGGNFSGVLSGTGGLTKQGAGTLTLSGLNTYSGDTTVAAGTLATTGAGLLSSATALRVASGAQVNLGGSQQVSAISGVGSTANVGTINMGGGTLTVDGTASTEFAGRLTNGNLIKDGSGTLTISGGANDHADTTIAGGTLVLGTGGTLGSGQVVNNAELRFNRSDDSTFSLNISGSGQLTHAGSGSTALTGSNSYTGITHIDAGTLQVGTGGNTGTLGSGNVVLNGGTLAMNRGTNYTLANGISGNGSLRQEGSGTLVLVGNNSYTGTTTVTAGGLQVGNGGSSGSLGNGNVVLGSGTTLTLNRADDTTVANTISGDGSLVKAGAGTAALTANNTYTGITSINQGALQAGAGGTTGTLGGGAVAIASGAQLRVNRANAITIANTLSGAGALVQTGNGTLVLTGNNSYSGGTNIIAGTLQVGNGGSSGTLGSGAVVNNAALFVNRSNAYALGNAISGSGSLTQIGEGSTTLSGNNSYSGATNVNNGNLIAAGGNAIGDGSNVTVASGARLDVNGAETMGSLSNHGQLVTTAALTAASLTSDGSVTLGADVTTTAGGQNYAGTLTTTGPLSLTSFGNVQAENASNNIGGTLTVVAQGQGQSVSLFNAGDLQASLSVAQDATVSSGSQLTVGGNVGGLLSTQAAGTTLSGGTVGALAVVSAGDVGQTGGIAVGGTADIQAAGHDITLNNPANTFGGLVSAVGNQVQLNSAGALSTQIFAANSANLHAGGALAVAGQADSLTTSAGATSFGHVNVAGDLNVTATGAVTQTGDLSIGGQTTLNAAGQDITLLNPGNRFAAAGVRISNANTAQIHADATGLTLLDVTLANGGRLETDGKLSLTGQLTLNGGTLGLVGNGAPAALALDDPDLAPTTAGVVLNHKGRELLAQGYAVEQTASGRIVTSSGSTLYVRAPHGSIKLDQAPNDIAGGISAVSGTLGETGSARFDASGSTLPLGLVRLQSTQINVAGKPPTDGSQTLTAAGIEGDAVKLKADRISTSGGGLIRARLPYDNAFGFATALPGITFVLTGDGLATPPASLPYGGLAEDQRIQVSVGDSVGGYITTRPFDTGGSFVFVSIGGPDTPRPFYDGADKPPRIRMFYNGEAPQTPQEVGALSAVTAVIEDSRRSRFEETVRTENVSARLRSGVIAEVGAGRPATEGRESIRTPATCEMAAGALACAGLPPPSAGPAAPVLPPAEASFP